MDSSVAANRLDTGLGSDRFSMNAWWDAETRLCTDSPTDAWDTFEAELSAPMMNTNIQFNVSEIKDKDGNVKLRPVGAAWALVKHLAAKFKIVFLRAICNSNAPLAGERKFTKELSKSIHSMLSIPLNVVTGQFTMDAAQAGRELRQAHDQQ